MNKSVPVTGPYNIMVVLKDFQNLRGAAVLRKEYRSGSEQIVVE